MIKDRNYTVANSVKISAPNRLSKKDKLQFRNKQEFIFFCYK